MSKYNLISNGSLQALTASGTGDIALTWAELSSLTDTVTSSGVVDVTSSGILCLEADLTDRIKVDGIYLYVTASGSILSDLEFYYKDYSDEAYVQCSKGGSGAYYYATIPEPSAPRFVKVVIDKSICTINEFQIFNDDYLVNFGEDGNETSKWIEDSPIGEPGVAETVKIFNNSTGVVPINAYVCVDYTGNDGDNLMELSESENGPWYAVEDGALMEDDASGPGYSWSKGSFNNTEVDAGRVTNTDDHILSGYKMNALPNGSDQAFDVGSNAWGYDRVNDKLYAIGMESSVLKLYSYDLKLNVWDTLGVVNIGGTSANNANMVYLDGYVYVVNRSKNFGRYNVNSGASNWEDLTAPPISYTLTSYDSITMVTDSEYIYAVLFKHGAANSDADNTFARYSTVSGGWDVMDSNYSYEGYLVGNYYFSNCLTYDYDRNCIYYICGTYTSGSYVQKYDIGTDTWTINWLYIYNIDGGSYTYNVAITYHGNNLYGAGSWSSTLSFFRYNFNTLIGTSIYTGFRFTGITREGEGTNIIATDPLVESNFPSSIYFAHVYQNEEYLYGYNVYTEAVGTYTSPVVILDDVYRSSYFIIDCSTSSEFNSVSYDENIYNGTIRVRSSSTEPLSINEVYWPGKESSQDNVTRIDLNTDVVTHTYVTNISTTTNTWCVVNPRNGDFVFSNGYYGYWYTRSKSGVSTTYDNVLSSFDATNRLWIYDRSNYYIRYCQNHSFSDQVGSLHYGGLDFVADMSASLYEGGLWFINSLENTLTYLDASVASVVSVVLSSPQYVSANSDGGCWVMDISDRKAYRYNINGVLVDTVDDLEATLGKMCNDNDDGFWYIGDNKVHHVNSGGIKDATVDVVYSPYAVIATWDGLISYSIISDTIEHIVGGAIVKTYTWEYGNGYTGIPGVFSYKYNDFINNPLGVTDTFPLSYDNVWGDSGTLEWKEVKKDGYFLPKEKYQQVEVTFRSSGVKPYLNKIIMAPSAKVQNIYPQSSQNVYVRTNITSQTENRTYDTRLKVWWDVNE